MILVVGSTGQLARHLQELIPQAMFWSRKEADLTQPGVLEDALRQAAPSVIINAAAYTAVDRAESEPDVAWRSNAESPAAIARVARALDIVLIHVSTDYVFDGASARPYVETDAVAPLGVYGATKLAGELAVRTICPRHYILRTSWVFSEHGVNFVKTMLRLGRERDSLRVVDDQHGRPTYAGDLARLIVALQRTSGGTAALPYGVWHTGGGSATTWCRFAQTIFERAHSRAMLSRIPMVQGIPTSEYPTPARRPLTSVLEPNRALEHATGVRFDWESGLDRVLDLLNEKTHSRPAQA